MRETKTWTIKPFYLVFAGALVYCWLSGRLPTWIFWLIVAYECRDLLTFWREKSTSTGGITVTRLGGGA